MKNLLSGIKAVYAGFIHGDLIRKSAVVTIVQSNLGLSGKEAESIVKKRLNPTNRVEGFSWNTSFVSLKALMSLLSSMTQVGKAKEYVEKKKAVRPAKSENAPKGLLSLPAPAPSEKPKLFRGMLKHLKTIPEIKAEYRRLVHIFHPDHGGTAEEIQFVKDQYEATLHVLGMREKLRRMKNE